MRKDENFYLKHGTICKNCHSRNRRKNKNNLIQIETSVSHQQPKVG